MTGFLDWLYGPKRVDHPQVVTLRSLVVDPDTVRQICVETAAATGETNVLRAERRDYERAHTLVSRVLDPDELGSAHGWELRNVVIGTEDGAFHVNLAAGQPARVTSNDPRFDQLREQVVQRLLDEGRPRPRWPALRAFWPQLLILDLVIAWGWALLSARPPASVTLFGSLVLVTLVGLLLMRHRTLEEQGLSGYAGSRVRPTSRQRLADDRADRHANWRVAAVTIPAAAFVTWLVQYLLGK